jgi:hypothetical protein
MGRWDYLVTIPDGGYSFDDLSNFIIYTQVSNGTYYVGADGNYNYLMSLSINQVKYAIQLVTYGVSSSTVTSAGWSIPYTASWSSPSVLTYPQWIINNSKFGTVIVYSVGLYPSVQTGGSLQQVTFLSSVAPQITQFNTLVLT